MYHPRIPFFKKAPFIRLLPSFIAGILLQAWTKIPIVFVLVMLALLLTCQILLRYQSISKQFKYQFHTGTGIYLLMICLGSIIFWSKDITHRQNWVGHYQTKGKVFLIQLLTAPIERKKSFKTTAAIWQLQDNDKWIAIKGKLLVYLHKENHSLKQGDVLLVNQDLQPIAAQLNPGGFDYTAYLNRQQIYHQLYIGAAQYQLLSQQKTSFLNRTKAYVLNVIRKNIRDKQQQAIAEALLVGYTFDIDDTLSDAYSKTGVIHIIAISGMHLGLVYAVLLLLTRTFKNTIVLSWLRPLLLLLSIWCFTLLVGAGASVLRAAVIISFFIASEWLNRKADPFNSLFASMFLLLCFNPNYLWDIGFQLSYTAVAGIMIFNKPIYQLCYFSFKPMRYCWQLISVTLSAQILTAPIVLFHFHQFPNYFLFTNLLIVPLSGMVLYACFILVLLSPIPLLASFVGQILNLVVGWMNECIFFAASLPYAVTEKIQISLFQVVGYFLGIIAVSYWLMRGKKYYLPVTCIMIAALLTDNTIKRIKMKQTNKLVVYHLPGNPVSEVFAGGEYLSFGTPSSLQLTQKMRYPTQTLFGGIHQKMVVNPEENPLIKVNKLAIVWFNSKVEPAIKWTPAEVDIVLLQNNPAISIALLHKRYKAKIYVWDSNNPVWKIRKWKKEADSLHLRHHSIPEQGAFVMDF